MKVLEHKAHKNTNYKLVMFLNHRLGADFERFLELKKYRIKEDLRAELKAYIKRIEGAEWGGLKDI